MRPNRLLLIVVLETSYALTEDTDQYTIASQLPPCVRNCVNEPMSVSASTATNLTCFCQSPALLRDFETSCLLKCTPKDSLVAQHVIQVTCDTPRRDRSKFTRITNVSLAGLSITCGIMRIVYKSLHAKSPLWWDDLVLIITLFAGLPSVIIIDRGVLVDGLGKDAWTIPLNMLTSFLRWQYVLEILYFLQLMLLKLALQLFLLQVFKVASVTTLLRLTVSFTCAFGTASLLAAVFQCWPISDFWTSWDKENAGHCISINRLAWASAGIHILLDVWMLGLPLYEVLHLRLTWKRKFSVMLMFFVGTFVTVISTLRLRSLIKFAHSSNPTWNLSEVSNWSIIEINVGIICVCMPTLRLALLHMVESIVNSTKLLGLASRNNQQE